MRHFKNNKLNIKLFVFIIFIVVIIGTPITKAETNNNSSAVNQQLIILLKQLIALLIQQIEELTKQLVVQQQAINNLNNTVFQSTSTLPYFVAEISSDKDAVKNDGADYATLTIVTKLSNGQVLPNKTVKINNQIYISDSNGIIIYKTAPTRVWDRCNNQNQILIVITENGDKNFSKIILIENIQTQQIGGGICA